jgi:hypothetical protein
MVERWLKVFFSFFPSSLVDTHDVGIVFDVSSKRDVYGPGGSYHVFAGKDGSKGLGKSSLKPEDAVPDYSSLTQEELKVLDDWVALYVIYVALLLTIPACAVLDQNWMLSFKKRYNIIGKVVQS